MKPKSVELLAFDRDQLQYEGKCKLRIDRLSEMLLVEPYNEEFKMKCALFKWDFVMDKNILFVFGEHELSDFALVFDEEERCKKVHDFICKDKSQNEVHNSFVYQRILCPVFEMIVKKEEKSLEMKKIIAKWIDKHSEEEKPVYIKLLKDKNIFNSVYSDMIIRDDGEKDSVSGSMTSDKHSGAITYADINKRNNSRKRKRSLTNNNSQNNNDIPNPRKNRKTLKTMPKFINQNLFKVVNVTSGNGILRRLLIFTTPEKTHCYEYGWSCQRQLYFCKGCKALRKHPPTAVFDKDELGFDCIKMEEKKHVCTPIPYTQGNYVEMKIFKKPNYDILENCNTKYGKMLIIFDKNDKKRCWEFRVEHQVKDCFRCCQCNTPARVWHGGTDDEHIVLKYPNHECNYVPYERKKFYKFKDFILSPDFEVQTVTTENGEEKKRLIIFDKNDRNFCYVYSSYNNTFLCLGCFNKKLCVSARLLQNSDGEDYVLLSKRKHICELRQYSGLAKKETIIRSPDFELMENTESGTRKLFISVPNNRSLCYAFSYRVGDKRYQCNGCNSIRRKRSRANSFKVVFAKLCKDENGENIVRLNDAKHVCEPTKYEPAKYAKKEIQKCYDYFFFRQKRFPTSVSVGIYHPENKNLCFKLNFDNHHCYFICNRCGHKRRSVITRIEKDEDGKEYFNHDYKKHLCHPMKVSSICAPEFVKLEKSDFSLNGKKMTKTDDKRTINSSNFELRGNAKGVPDASLFVFNSKDHNMGYKYYYTNGYNKYVCCAKKSHQCHAAARIQNDENGEKCVIMGKAEHKCKPVKYEKIEEKQIINASDYIFVPQHGCFKVPKIIVFATPARDLCHEFNFVKTRNYYQCIGCYTTVKLCKDENGKEYLKMSKQNHACTPRKYNKPKIIPQELFFFHLDTKGEPNKRMIVFTSDKKDFVYEFESTSKYSYRCNSCRSKKIGVTVKICENEIGIKYLECGDKEHVCQPHKYNPEKYKIQSNEIT